MNALASRFIELLPIGAYAEVSPSGRGIRAMVRCPSFLAGIKDEESGIEIYPDRRYLNLTGDCIRNLSTQVLPDGKELLRWLVKEAGREWPMAKGEVPSKGSRVTTRSHSLTKIPDSDLIPPGMYLPRKGDGTVDRSTALYRLAARSPVSDRDELIEYLKRCDRELWDQPKYQNREYEYERITRKVLLSKEKHSKDGQPTKATVTVSDDKTLSEKRAKTCEELIEFALLEPSWVGVEGITEFYSYLAMVTYAWDLGQAREDRLEVVMDLRGHAIIAGIGSRDAVSDAVRRLAGSQKRKPEKEKGMSRIEHGLIRLTPHRKPHEASRYELLTSPLANCTRAGHCSYTGGEESSGLLVCATLLRIRRLCGHRTELSKTDLLQLTKLGGVILARLSATPHSLEQLAQSLERRKSMIRARYLEPFVKANLVELGEDGLYSVTGDLGVRVEEYLKSSGMIARETKQLVSYETQQELRSEYLSNDYRDI